MSGFKVFSNRKDLDAVFTTRTASDPSSQVAVPFVTPAGQNLSDRYLPYIDGEPKAPATGFKCFDNSGNMIDLRDLYSKAPSWNAVGLGTSGTVATVYVLDASNVYVGGTFVTVRNTDGTSITCNNIAKWNSTTSAWSALGSGTIGTSSNVSAIHALDASNVYIGGNFLTAGGITVNRIAKWDGSNWNALGSGTKGTSGDVYAIRAVDASNVYVGGLFVNAGDVSCNNIAKWDGVNWNRLGTATTYGANQQVNSIHSLDASNVYIGGVFEIFTGLSCRRVAKWDGYTCTRLGTDASNNGTSSYVQTIYALDPSNVYVGGGFINANAGVTANQVPSKYISKWNGFSWSALSLATNPSINGTNTFINTIYAVDASNVYVGGAFHTAGDVSCNRIARYDGTRWDKLDSGTNANVRTITKIQNSKIIYAGGDFTTADGIPCNYIAQWS